MSVMGDGDGMAFENGTGLLAKGEKKGKKEEKEKREKAWQTDLTLLRRQKNFHARGHFFLFWQFLLL
jgi:hypothetical protein